MVLVFGLCLEESVMQFILLLICCGQFTVSVAQPAFTVSVEQPALAVPTTKPPASVKQTVTTQSSIYNGKAGSSHKNRASLINHLLTEGVHSGRHTSQQVNAMTDSELDALHNSDHGSKPSQQPTIRMKQSACPGGRCPVPTNRRRMFR